MNSDIEQLLENASRKRRALRDEAFYKRSRRRFLSVASGLLAFASGASILSVLGAFLPNSDAVKLVAALFAFMSTLVTIVSQTYFDDREILKMFEGAAEFHAISDKIEQILSAANDLTDKAVQKAIADVRKEYRNATKKYDDVVPVSGFSERQPMRRSVPPPQVEDPEE
jgi:hypothetical protein